MQLGILELSSVSVVLYAGINVCVDKFVSKQILVSSFHSKIVILWHIHCCMGVRCYLQDAEPLSKPKTHLERTSVAPAAWDFQVGPSLVIKWQSP